MSFVAEWASGSPGLLSVLALKGLHLQTLASEEDQQQQPRGGGLGPQDLHWGSACWLVSIQKAPPPRVAVAPFAGC